MDEYARIARFYDRAVGPALRPVHRSMAAGLAAKGLRSVLDLCCGTGTLAGMMTDKGFRAVGVDLSPAMLAQARKKHPAATFIDGDAASLFFDDDSFDAAVVSFALHEKPESTALAILAEARRVVRTGGTILAADYRIPSPMQAHWVGALVHGVERLAGREHYGHFRRYMEKGGTDAFLTRAGLLNLPAASFFKGWGGVYVAAGD